MDDATSRDNLICMVGTDHGLAPADVRSAFTLPEDVRAAELESIKGAIGATGIVVLATCNRTELWASFDGVEPPARSIGENGVPRADDPMVAALCAAHRLDPADYAHYFVCRAGNDAVGHLFQVACGLRSAIVAEDQIVSQVKQALANARELGVADSCLEVLFRQAVTAAKQVKSGVRFTRAYTTAVDQAIARLEEDDVDLAQSTCMVIGNGAYGRLAASTLAQKGARVMVTVRQYTHGAVRVPSGCEGVPYANRYGYVPGCDVIMSATTSPHYTLVREQFEQALAVREDKRPLHIFDLAIPRDVDPAIAEIGACVVHDIDEFVTEIGQENAKAIEAAQKLLDSGINDFWDWVRRRDVAAHVKPPTSSFFPLFVDWSEKKAVFVGGGTIALRRIRTLLPFVGDIVVYAPDFTPEIERFAADGAVTLVHTEFEPSVLDDADIVFACTNSAEINDEVWAECKRRGVLVNVCSDRFKCDFHFPGIVQRDNVVVGVNAGGKDHRRVKQLRARIDRLMDEEDV